MMDLSESKSTQTLDEKGLTYMQQVTLIKATFYYWLKYLLFFIELLSFYPSIQIFSKSLQGLSYRALLQEGPSVYLRCRTGVSPPVEGFETMRGELCRSCD